MKYIVALALVVLTAGCTKSETPHSSNNPKDSVVTSYSASVLNYFLSPTEIKKGERVRLKVMANMSDGTTQDADNLNWTFEYDGEKLAQGETNDGVLKIEQPDKKTVFITGLKEGEVLVHVTLAATSGANGKTVSQMVKVKNPIQLPANSGAEQVAENVYQLNVNEDEINNN